MLKNNCTWDKLSHQHTQLVSCMCHKIHSWINFYLELMLVFSLITDEEVELECSLDRDTKDCQRVYWEREFKPVAEKLLNRIQSHHSSSWVYHCILISQRFFCWVNCIFLIYLYIVGEHDYLKKKKSEKPGIYVLDAIFERACMKFLHV